MAKEALAAFEATLKKEPNRLGAYVGAAKAAEKSGDTPKAREYYEKIVAIAGDADNTRTEVADARAFLKNAMRVDAAIAREHVVRAFLLLIVLSVLATPAGRTIASGARLCRRARRMGVDRHRHGKASGGPRNSPDR